MLDMSRRNGRDHSTPRGGPILRGRNNPLPTNRDFKGIIFSLLTEETVLVHISVKKLFCSYCSSPEDLNTSIMLTTGGTVHREVLNYFILSDRW